MGGRLVAPGLVARATFKNIRSKANPADKGTGVLGGALESADLPGRCPRGLRRPSRSPRITGMVAMSVRRLEAIVSDARPEVGAAALAQAYLGVGWLPGLSGVRQAPRRRVRHPVTEHPRERSGERVQRAWRSAAGGGMEARDAGPSMYPRIRSGDRSPPTPLSGDTGISSAVGWINLNYAAPPASRLVWSCYPFTLR